MMNEQKLVSEQGLLNGRESSIEISISQLGKRESAVLLAYGLVTAVLYAICFTGEDVLPQASFPLFCIAAIILLYVGLKQMGYLKNRCAFLWAVPIVAIALCNGIFELSVLNYLNVVIIHFLFAMLGISSVHEDKPRFYRIELWIDLLRTIAGNWIVAFAITPRVMKRRDGVKIKDSVVLRVIMGICLAVPVLMVILVLMLSADAVFNELFQSVIRKIESWNMNIFGNIITIFLGFIYFAGYGFNLRYMNKTNAIDYEKKCDAVIATTFLSLVNILFLIFCIVQVAFLFTGGYMMLPQGLVYSEYAREGFFQLLFITIINFSVIIVFLCGFPDCLKMKGVKWLLCALCLFTAVLICSSFYRMNLYIKVYDYTPLRMMVLTFLSMETVLVIITFFHLSRQSLDFMKLYIYTALFFYMAVNVSASNIVVANLNINQYCQTMDGELDLLVIGVDGAGLLIDLYESTPDDNLKTKIKWKLVELNANEFNYEDNNHWQNATLVRSLNKGRLKTFLETER